MHPANELPNLKRRVNRARRNQGGVCVTCPASRHVHMIADQMLRGGGLEINWEDAECCAGSLLSVLESLWKARARIAELEKKNV
jgi:hypothetical protein